ncbi:MAG: class I SAM-dependent methyltransferase [Bacteroidota bacterium]
MNSKEYFDNVAHQWDRMRKTFFSESVRERAFTVAGLSCIQKGKLAADIGAGTGFVTEGLIDKGLKVIAVDQSEAMLSEMRKKLAGVEGIDYRVGVADKLPVADEAVDYVFDNMYLHHVDDPPAAIKEMVRILKPGGKLVVTDLDAHNFEFLKTEQHDRWMGFNREDVRLWFEEAELKNIFVDCVGENCCARSNTGTEAANISIFVASGEK